MNVLTAIFTVLATALVSISAVCAHDSRPLFIDVTEQPGGIVQLSWKTPPSVPPSQAPVIVLSEPCTANSNNVMQNRLQGTVIYDCMNGLASASVQIAYPLYNPSLLTLVRVAFNNGETRSAMLDPSKNEWRIPQNETFGAVAKSYFYIGVDHILGGIDHLLFLAGLLYIARTPRRILITVTGFTIAHSITIFLVALNVIRISVAAVETVIALSIIFLAAEIARSRRDTLTWRRPILVAGGFGLVHGAGFASALSEYGLPQTEKISALGFFNIGVEAGQLAIVACVLAIAWFTKRTEYISAPTLNRTPVRTVFSYGLGIVSALWFFQRLAATLV